MNIHKATDILLTTFMSEGEIEREAREWATNNRTPIFVGAERIPKSGSIARSVFDPRRRGFQELLQELE